MKKIFLVYGHYNENSFNAAIKNEFIKHSELKGNKVDVVDLYKEKFDPVFAGEDPSAEVLDHRKRIEECDTIVLVNLRKKKAVIFCTYGSPRLAITTFFLNLPIRRLKRGVFHMCGIYNITYRRYFAVPFVSDSKRQEFLDDVRKTANNI